MNAVLMAETIDLSRDVATRLHAQLIARRDDEVARLRQLAKSEDHAFLDEHSEISATVASDTLRDIEHALTRFDAGTYGSCESCGGAIPVERLEAIPQARTCVGCAAALQSVTRRPER